MNRSGISRRSVQTCLAIMFGLACFAVTVIAAGGTTNAAGLTAGFAEADITPASGMEAPGGYGKSYHQTVHDPCKIRVAVFGDGEQRVAVVGVDAIGVHGEMVQAAREAIHARCGIEPKAILVAASHSHSSGPLCGVMPGSYDHASALVRKLAYEQSTCTSMEYYQQVLGKVVDAVCQADAARIAARCGAGKGVEDKVAFNRRFRMRNGLTYTHPGQGNPDIIEPAGPTDPDVGVIGAWNEQGKLLGCIVNFACHATTSPGGISANYVYYLEQTIRGAFGQDVIVVFLPGTSGDVTQVDNLNPSENPPAEPWARLVGGRVGAEAVKVLLSMAAGDLGPLSAGQAVLDIVRRAPTPERLQNALELVQQDVATVGHTDWTFAKETVMLDALLQKKPRAAVEVQAIQIGPVVLLGLPAEVFCQFGLDLKSASKFPLTFPVSFANDCVGYIPTEEAFGEHGGGYETRLSSYTNLDITAGKQMVEAALTLANKMAPGAIPTRSPHAPFEGPWTYGNVPPQVH
jgi:neutral ceramidase